MIEPELTAIILTLILPLPFKDGSLPIQPLKLTLFIALTISRFEGFFGPLFLVELTIGEGTVGLDLERPPRRLLSRAFASDDALGFGLDRVELDDGRDLSLLLRLLVRLLVRLLARLLARLFARLLALLFEGLVLVLDALF